jgi:signal transduction histidine kinase/ActR/RegA family two-component response regulator
MSEGNPALERAVRETNWRFNLLGALALLGLVVLTALILLQQRTDAERDRAIARQQHTFDVIIRANQLSAEVSSAEAALGRYVVSADRTLGQQYTEHWARAAEQLTRLQQLTTDSPQQQARIVKLRQAVEARGKELNATALYSTFKRHRDAWGSYYNVRQSPARTQVEALLGQIVEAERGVLGERTRAASDLIDNSSLAARILTGFGVLIVLGAVLAGWLAIEAQGERAASEANADAERARAAELQEAVAAATAQLRAEASEREQAEARLRQAQKMEAVGQLTGGIAHDFNNMLAVVLGGIELARRQMGAGSGGAKLQLDNALEGANRAAALTRQLLAFARSEPLLPEAIRAAPLIEGMAGLLDRTLGDTISVETRDDDKSWHIWVDRHQLENALLNLAVNARDAMNGRGTLRIATGGTALTAGEIGDCDAGDYVTIAVTDTGCGMAPEVVERVFEPFFTTKPMGQGTGLGLSQIFGFVRRSGGEIAIDTGVGQGTTVTLYLPRHLGEAASDAATPLFEMPTELAEARSLDILVVEDDPRVLNATLGALEELGHRPQGCSEPAQAAQRLAGMPGLDLIVTDVLMPGETGPEMIARLDGELAGVAVLFVTGYAGEADAGMFRGRTVLRKPFTISALARAVSEAVDQEARSGRQAAAE